MEAAALFTVGALRGVAGRLPAHRQRHRRRGRVHADHRRRAARGGRPDDAGRARDGDGRPLASTVFLVNPASANGSTGRRWPELAQRAASLGLDGDALISRAPGQLGELARDAAADGATLLVVVGGDGTVNEVVNGIAGRDGTRARGDPARHGLGLRAHVRHPARASTAPFDVALDGRRAHVDAGRASYRAWGGDEAEAYFANVGERGHERRGRAARERDVEGARRQGLLLLGDARRLRRAGRTPRCASRSTARAAGAGCTTSSSRTGATSAAA